MIDGLAGGDRLELLRVRLGGALGEGAASAASMDAWEQAVAVHGQGGADPRRGSCWPGWALTWWSWTG